MKDDPHIILRIIAKIFIPLIFLFALYVQFHGDARRRRRVSGGRHRRSRR